MDLEMALMTDLYFNNRIITDVVFFKSFYNVRAKPAKTATTFDIGHINTI